MKRSLALFSLVAAFGLTACGEPQVVTEASITQEGSNEVVALADLPVRLLPYDRDAIFDSLTQAAAQPEPAIPPEILAQQQAVQDAQTQWRAAEERWGVVRDSLRSLSERMQQMTAAGQRATPQYNQAFQQFGRLEQEERTVNQRMQAAFQRFDELQRSTLAAADSVRVVREMWAEEAYRDFDRVVAARLEAEGREELADTTNAQGVAVFNAPAGRWWVYARYALPYSELYWNVPIEVTGDSTHVQLTRENAEVRPIM